MRKLSSLVCKLEGAVPLMAELIKHIDTHIEMDLWSFQVGAVAEP